MIYFDHLPVEICMMVFDHLVTDVISLGTICKVSHNWKTITQASYAWKLWIYAKIGKNKAKKYITEETQPCFNVLFSVQCVPDDVPSNYFKMLLTKKFLFCFLENINSIGAREHMFMLWYGLIFTSNNIQLLQLLQKIFDITVDISRAMDNKAFHYSCANGKLDILKYLHTGFGLTIVDARENRNNAIRSASDNGHLDVVKYLHTHFGLDADDARSAGNYALHLACSNGHLPIVEYLHTGYGLDTNDARSDDNCALRWVCENAHWSIVDYLYKGFGLTAADAHEAINWLRIKADYDSIDYISHVFGLMGYKT